MYNRFNTFLSRFFGILCIFFIIYLFSINLDFAMKFCEMELLVCKIIDLHMCETRHNPF